MAFRPYLAFNGNCREAFTRYQEIFGGELVLLTMADTPADAGAPPPGANADAIMHAALMAGDALLMGADDMSGSFDGAVDGICVNCAVPDIAESKRGIRRARRRWRDPSTARGDLLRAGVRHVHRPLWNAVDDHGRTTRRVLTALTPGRVRTDATHGGTFASTS